MQKELYYVGKTTAKKNAEKKLRLCRLLKRLI